jgi:hypothetical protein
MRIPCAYHRTEKAFSSSRAFIMWFRHADNTIQIIEIVCASCLQKPFEALVPCKRHSIFFVQYAAVNIWQCVKTLYPWWTSK